MFQARMTSSIFSPDFHARLLRTHRYGCTPVASLQDATDVPDPYTSEGLDVSYVGCVAFDASEGESVRLATINQGTVAGGIASATQLPLGDVDDSSLEGM